MFCSLGRLPGLGLDGPDEAGVVGQITRVLIGRKKGVAAVGGGVPEFVAHGG